MLGATFLRKRPQPCTGHFWTGLTPRCGSVRTAARPPVTWPCCVVACIVFPRPSSLKSAEVVPTGWASPTPEPGASTREVQAIRGRRSQPAVWRRLPPSRANRGPAVRAGDPEVTQQPRTGPDRGRPNRQVATAHRPTRYTRAGAYLPPEQKVGRAGQAFSRPSAAGNHAERTRTPERHSSSSGAIFPT